MKTIVDFVKKIAAKWVLGYLPNLAVWAIKYGADKARDEEKWARVLDAIKLTAADAKMVAEIMEDGLVTDVEEDQVRGRVSDLVDDIKELL